MLRTDISPMRPSHVHFLIKAPGYREVIARLFKKSCPYLKTDVVYGVKAPLIAEFRQVEAGARLPTGAIADQPFWLLEYDFILPPTSRTSCNAASRKQQFEANGSYRTP